MLGEQTPGDGLLMSETPECPRQLGFVSWAGSSSGFLLLDEVSAQGEPGLFVACGVMEGAVGVTGLDAPTEDPFVAGTHCCRQQG